jgi:hypothetical protein
MQSGHYAGLSNRDLPGLQWPLLPAAKLPASPPAAERRSEPPLLRDELDRLPALQCSSL